MYDKLKKIIQESNPEIMELKEGCKVKFYFNVNLNNYEYSTITGIKSDTVFTIDHFRKFINVHHGYYDKHLIKEVLGRPITLADVLIAIYKNIPDLSLCSYYGYEHYFEFHFDGEKIFTWNMKDNNLDNQSEETKQFLIDLLVK